MLWLLLLGTCHFLCLDGLSSRIPILHPENPCSSFQIHPKCHLLCKALLDYPKERNYFSFGSIALSQDTICDMSCLTPLTQRPLHSILWLWQVSLPTFCPLLTCLETGYFFPSLVLAPQNATATLLNIPQVSLRIHSEISLNLAPLQRYFPWPTFLVPLACWFSQWRTNPLKHIFLEVIVSSAACGLQMIEALAKIQSSLHLKHHQHKAWMALKNIIFELSSYGVW